MPAIKRFGALSVVLRYKDHPPPHLHLIGGGANVSISIRDRTVLKGRMPRGLDAVVDWIADNEDVLLDAWMEAEAALPLSMLADSGGELHEQ